MRRASCDSIWCLITERKRLVGLFECCWCGLAMSRRDYDFFFKIIVVGNAAVGKSSLMIRYVVGGVLPTSTQYF